MDKIVDSDHYPLRVSFIINLSAKCEKPERISYEYTKCDEEHKSKYNKENYNKKK